MQVSTAFIALFSLLSSAYALAPDGKTWLEYSNNCKSQGLDYTNVRTRATEYIKEATDLGSDVSELLVETEKDKAKLAAAHAQYELKLGMITDTQARIEELSAHGAPTKVGTYAPEILKASILDLYRELEAKKTVEMPALIISEPDFGLDHVSESSSVDSGKESEKDTNEQAHIDVPIHTSVLPSPVLEDPVIETLLVDVNTVSQIEHTPSRNTTVSKSVVSKSIIKRKTIGPNYATPTKASINQKIDRSLFPVQARGQIAPHNSYEEDFLHGSFSRDDNMLAVVRALEQASTRQRTREPLTPNQYANEVDKYNRQVVEKRKSAIPAKEAHVTMFTLNDIEVDGAVQQEKENWFNADWIGRYNKLVHGKEVENISSKSLNKLRLSATAYCAGNSLPDSMYALRDDSKTCTLKKVEKMAKIFVDLEKEIGLEVSNESELISDLIQSSTLHVEGGKCDASILRACVTEIALVVAAERSKIVPQVMNAAETITSEWPIEKVNALRTKLHELSIQELNASIEYIETENSLPANLTMD